MAGDEDGDRTFRVLAGALELRPDQRRMLRRLGHAVDRIDWDALSAVPRRVTARGRRPAPVELADQP